MRARSLRLLVLLLCVSVGRAQLAFPFIAAEPSPVSTAVHDQLLRRGVGHGVKLVRADGSEVKGRIIHVSDDSVDLQTKGAASLSNVRFSDVARVRNPGLSTGAKVGIGVGIGIVVSAGIAAIVINHEVNKPWNF